jgi:hypothetical protein
MPKMQMCHMGEGENMNWQPVVPYTFSSEYARFNTDRKKGLIDVPRTCTRCGVVPERTIHAHHESYRFARKVTWLCHKCHKQRHRELNLWYTRNVEMFLVIAIQHEAEKRREEKEVYMKGGSEMETRITNGWTEERDRLMKENERLKKALTDLLLAFNAEGECDCGGDDFCAVSIAKAALAAKEE